MLRRFVPAYLAGQALAVLPTTPSARQVPAAVLLADIVGYTSLTERGSRQGTDGAERLGSALRDVFACVEEAVLAHGGDIFGFAGDSVLALWPISIESDMGTIVRRSMAAALAAQSSLRRLPKLPDESPLRMRLAVAAGNATLCLVGGHNGQWRCFAAGDAVLEAASGIVVGKAGTVCCAPSAWRSLRGTTVGTPANSGFVDVHEDAVLWPTRAVEAGLDSSIATVPDEVSGGEPEGLRRFVPDLVLQLLDAGQGDWLAEFRTVTTMFVGLRSLAPNAVLTLDALDRSVADIQAVVGSCEGAVTRVGCDDKGVHVLCVWGVPGRFHEDDAARSVRAALDLRTRLSPYGVMAAIGIGTGRALCGLSGGYRRCEYTVSGATVNLAAHLMAAARDEVLCDSATQLAAGPWSFERVTRAIAKVGLGKQPVWSVSAASHSGDETGGRGDGTFPTEPRMFAGRRAELHRLQSLMDALVAGSGGSVVVEGPAGAGKSALVQTALMAARRHGVRVISATALSIEHRTAYFAWRGVLPQLLDSSGNATKAALREGLRTRCMTRPLLQQWLPVLEDVFPLGMLNTIETSRMNEGARADSVAEIFIHLIRQATGRQPTVLVFDDVHWLDSASAALLTRVRLECDKLLLAIVTRDGGSETDRSQTSELRQQLVSGSDVTVVGVGALSRTETHALLLQALRVEAVDSALLDLVHAHTQGHALFVVEAVKSLLESGAIAVGDNYARLADQIADASVIALPASVDKLIASRFDRMPLAHQLTLKVASVLGLGFSPQVLAQVHPTGASRTDIANQLMVALDIGLVAQKSRRAQMPESTSERTDRRDLGDMDFVFTHAVTRDVIYGLLPLSQRRLLHSAVARAIEANHAETSDEVLPVLAHHWSLTDDASKAVHYLSKAGEQSFVRHGYREAVGFLRQALALLDAGNGQEQVPLRGLCERLLGHAWLGLGNLAEARCHLERSLALLGRPVPRTQWGRIGGAAVEAVVQISVRLLGWRRFRPAVVSRPAIATDAHALFRLGHVAWFQSDPLTLLYTGFRGLNIAERDGPSLDLARFFAGMAIIVGAGGLRRQADRYLDLSSAVARRLDDPMASAQSAMFSAMYWVGVADWKRASPSIEAAMELGRQLGDNRQLDECAVIAAFVCMHSGQLSRAAALFDECVRRGRMRGDVQTTAWGLLGVARVFILQGAFEMARDALAAAAPLAADHHSAIELQGQRALVRMHAQDWEACEHDAAMALRLIRQSRPLSFSTLIGTAAVAQVYLTLAERSDKSGNRSHAKACIKQARDTLAALRRFAGVFPIGRPLLLLLLGQGDAMAGHTGKALARWRQAGEVAARLGLPYERACADAALLGRGLAASAFMGATTHPTPEAYVLDSSLACPGR